MNRAGIEGRMAQPTRLQRIQLKSPREIQLMREAGKVVAEALALVQEQARPGSTTAELEATVADVFKRHGAESLFKNYPSPTKGVSPFPSVVCSSVNEVIVHGIPNRRPLREGDIVSIDTGCRVHGWCGDSAITVPIGTIRPELQRLLDVTKQTLDLAIRSMETCQYWSEVADLMEKHVKGHGFSVIEKFVGHGIGRQMHEDPQVPNFVSKALKKNDIRLEPGTVLAIEPMVAMGTKNVSILGDGWTVVTKDGRPAAHFEHTVAITPDGPRILTLPPDQP